MDRTTLKLGAVAAAAIFVVVACGGADVTPSPTAAPTAAPVEATLEPVVTTPVPADDDDAQTGGSSGAGTATLTVGDESYLFDGVFCAFSPEEAGTDRISFTMVAAGTIQGTDVQMGAIIQDTQEQGRYDGEGTIHVVSLNDVEDLQDPAIAWEALSGFDGDPEWVVVVDGKSVSVTADFDDGRTEEAEAVAGTLEATCP